MNALVGGGFDDAGRVAGYYYVIGDVVGDYAVGTHYDAVADGHSGTHGDAAAQPAVVADADGQSGLNCLATFEVVVRVVGGQQLAVGTYERVVADGDAAAIEEYAVEVDDDPLAECDAFAVVAVEGWDDECRRMSVGQEVFGAAVQFVDVPCATLVQCAHGLVGVPDAGLNLRVRIVVRQVVEHLFVFSHCVK